MNHHQFVVVGGGTAGITVAARLLNVDPTLDIALIELSEQHYYQPLWTLVGGGMFTLEESGRDNAGLILTSVNWIKDCVACFSPHENYVTTRNGE